jgi:hypothetical protein
MPVLRKKVARLLALLLRPTGIRIGVSFGSMTTEEAFECLLRRDPYRYEFYFSIRQKE